MTTHDDRGPRISMFVCALLAVCFAAIVGYLLLSSPGEAGVGRECHAILEGGPQVGSDTCESLRTRRLGQAIPVAALAVFFGNLAVVSRVYLALTRTPQRPSHKFPRMRDKPL